MLTSFKYVTTFKTNNQRMKESLRSYYLNQLGSLISDTFNIGPYYFA